MAGFTSIPSRVNVDIQKKDKGLILVLIQLIPSQPRPGIHHRCLKCIHEPAEPLLFDLFSFSPLLLVSGESHPLCWESPGINLM